MVWLVGIITAAIFWTLSAMPFVEQLNKVQIFEQLELNFRTVFVQIGAVALMFPVIRLLFLKPFEEALNTRTRTLESTYSEAENLKQHMSDLKASYEEKLAKSEAEAREKIQAAITEAQQMKEQILNDARNQALEIRDRTTEDLQLERQKMLVELRTHVVDLTLLASEKIIGASLDDERQRKLIGDFIEKAEVRA